MSRFLPTLLILAFSLSMLNAVEIVAHRGASHDAPENTLAAFKLAWEQKADGIEVDIYLTQDGKIVGLHDKDTLRTTGQKFLPTDKTLAELQTLDAGSWKDARWKGEPLPALADVLATLPDHGHIYIEIKCGAEVLPELQRVIKDSKKRADQITLIDFTFETLVQARPMFPDLELLWLVSGKKNEETKEVTYPDMNELADKAKAAGLDGLDLNHKFPLTKEAVDKIKSKDLTLAVWTVNDPADAKRLTEAGVDAITTDRPQFIREALGSGGTTSR